MYQFTNLEIPLNDYLTKDTRKTGKELQALVSALVVRQNALVDMEIQFNSLPLTEIANWGDIAKQYAQLLIEETGLRKSYDEWLALERKDKLAQKDKALIAYDKLKLELQNSMVKLGFRAEDPVAMAIVNRHPQLIELYGTANSSPIESYATQNNEAIQHIERELSTLRKNRVI